MDFQRRPSMLGIAVITGAVIASIAPAQTPRQLAPCPQQRDTLSLLQPSDSAFGDAPAFADFLRHLGFVVRCITRSTAAGLLGIGRVAGFQTDLGTITVLFVPEPDRVDVTEARTTQGYRYTFVKSGLHPAHAVLNTAGPVYYLARGAWLMEIWDASLALRMRQLVLQRE